jgi:bla regulator protein BlaR1
MIPLSDHLWQSTLFSIVAGLLTLALRKNPAQVRYWLWMSASFKFLVPFSLLIAVGGQIHFPRWAPPAPDFVQPHFPMAMGNVFVPSKIAAASPVSAPLHANLLPLLLQAVWGCGVLFVLFRWFREWLRIRAAVRTARPLHLDPPVRAMSSPAQLEPGVFGIWRPMLLLPDGIMERLTPAQLAAIVAHEQCHIRRRDNLAAAFHMVVEAIFWFHPLVWWLGRRIVDERERACDEEVLRQGNSPETYAEGILKVCEFYLESPLVCVPGVTGSNLRKRIRTIMTNNHSKNLNMGQKLLLSVATLAAVGAPVIIGLTDIPPMLAQSDSGTHVGFEVASVKPNKSEDWHSTGMGFQNDRFFARNVPLHIIIATAYNVPFQSKRVTGDPKWVFQDRFDIEATVEKGAIPSGTPATVRNQKMRAMLQALLADRFKLTIRRETVEQPVYALVIGKNGPKLQKADVDDKNCSYDDTCHRLGGGQGRGLHGKAIDMSDVVLFVANWTDKPVVDKTGLTGLYNIETEGWVPFIPRSGPPGDSAEEIAMADPSRPTLYAVFDRLGLKLESQKAPVDMYVIEHVEQPTEN